MRQDVVVMSHASLSGVSALRDVPLLRDAVVERGSRWVYSAGFNVPAVAGRRELPVSARIDSEVADLRRLVRGGARVALLSHQGDGPASAAHLGHVADYLGHRLGTRVQYVPAAVGGEAVDLAHTMAPGSVTVFGNTRFYAGEQNNDPQLAAEFAKLGDQVAVGGFSKAHRAHASNVGILAHRPAFLADSVVREVTALDRWAGTDESHYSVAVLGGMKREKVEVGLAYLVDRYDLVIAGGVVLNALLRAGGHSIGGSFLGTSADRMVAAARMVRSRPRRAELHVASEVFVRAAGNRHADVRRARVSEPIPDADMIVDFVLEPWALGRLSGSRGRPVRCLLAGTPALYVDGCRATTDVILGAFALQGDNALLLGGDTVAELPWSGRRSAGGGSALTFLATGSCPVLDAMRGRPVSGRRHA
ncbi:hypothetical protein GCM10009557_07810 [Virgisporangium ochraceum]|uniref:Phosphoglycerate kinase n=1 Tax=Virgisporangium ochraceum TaxID=65505 RepID=A0A8J4EFJ3_9ACTN|nr:phosphoglycerate kinase [Virgisporangium ochraceum]GIJ72703.1 hypothetical protein Voc01_076200 [Virgisporangium ochraceum]